MVKKPHPPVDSSDFDGRIGALGGFIQLLWCALLQVIILIFDVLRLSTRSAYDKDLEILILRRQLAILQRHNQLVVRPDRDDKSFLPF